MLENVCVCERESLCLVRQYISPSLLPLSHPSYTHLLSLPPHRYIQPVDEHRASVPDLVDVFLNDKNKLKSLDMKKEIGFDFDKMRQIVKGEVR